MVLSGARLNDQIEKESMSIKLRLMGGFLGIALLVGITGVIAVLKQLQTAEQTAVIEARELSEIINLTVSQGEEDLQSFLTYLYITQQRGSEVVDLNKLIIADAVLEDVGTIFTHDLGNEVGLTLQDGQVRTFVETSEEYPQAIQQLVGPLRNQEGKIIGAIIVEYTTFYAEMRGAAEATGRTIAIYTFACVILALTLGYFISASIAGPILKLRDAAVQIEQGQLDVRLPRAGRDEIGQLVSSFAHMTGQLRQTQTGLEQRIAERTSSLRDSEERYALAVQGANDGLWDWNLKTDRIYFSPRWKAMLGYNEDEIDNKLDEWFSRVHPDDVQRVKAEVASHLEGHATHFENEHRVLHKDGSYRWMLCRGLAVWEAGSRAYRMAGSQTDITARKKVEEQLIYDSLHDALTGLPNRALFLDRLGHTLNRTKRHLDRKSAVLFLDVDRFKVINDSLGHMAGDHMLIATARRLESCLRVEDTLARLGGDEFAIVLDDTHDISDAARVAERIQRRLTSTALLSGHDRSVTASIGIAMITPDYTQPEDILRDADTAMYRAKASGKARHQIFDATMHASVLAQLQMEADLRQAIGHQELRIYFQPIVSAANGRMRMIGAEALVRWQHPQRGLVSPAEFIPVAEETGLIIAMDEWMMHKACAHAKAWHAAGHTHLSVSVNISARQFQDQSFPKTIQSILQETGLPAHALKIEITESVAMRDLDISIRLLNELNAMGIQISIDDFGTGYSSMGYLKRFPLHVLKIDQSFIKDITHDPDSQVITNAMIVVAHSLKLAVIAEGVETEEQSVILRSLGCDAMQGYLFGRPMPAEAFVKLLPEGLAV